ncbi:MAG: hypothetical protein ACYDBJ_27040 [Aggregatilineales bacterium]
MANDVTGQEAGNGEVRLDQLGRLRDEIVRTLANAPASPVPASPSESDQSSAPKLQILRGGKYTPLRPK